MTFAEKVYKVVKSIPRGKVASYKSVAVAVGTTSYRAVGQALKGNPYTPEVPCHRVVSSSGKVGGFMGEISGKNLKRKIEILRSEGVEIENNLIDQRFFTIPINLIDKSNS